MVAYTRIFCLDLTNLQVAGSRLVQCLSCARISVVLSLGLSLVLPQGLRLEEKGKNSTSLFILYFFKERKIFFTFPLPLYVTCQENCTHWVLCHMLPSYKELGECVFSSGCQGRRVLSDLGTATQCPLFRYFISYLS